MTVTTTINFKEYEADGIATKFTIPFLLLSNNDLKVYLNGNQITAGYTLNGVGNPISEIVFTTALKGKLLLQRSIALLRETDYQENGDLLAKTVNQDFDRLYLALQGTAQDNTKALRVPDTEGLAILPLAAGRANKVLAFDGEGQPLLVTTKTGTAEELAVNLADPSSSEKGAGLIGCGSNINYPANTTGFEINQLKELIKKMPVITTSTQIPNDSQGKDGDVWLVYIGGN